MAMGIVSDKDFEKEKESLSQSKSTPLPTSQSKIVSIERGRGEGNIETPDSLRKLIGQTHVNDGRSEAINLAKNFGISQSAAAAYAQGATSTATYNDRPNEPFINTSRKHVQNRALSKLKRALHHITDDKLENAKVRDLAGIARDMATVVKTMEPESDKSKEGGEPKPQFIIYAPQIKKEESYDVIYAKE